MCREKLIAHCNLSGSNEIAHRGQETDTTIDNAILLVFSIYYLVEMQWTEQGGTLAAA